LGRVLPFRASRDSDDEKHVHPLQLDVIERVLQLWSNPGESVFTPFMGVGSEVCGALMNGRKGLGVELKPSYYKQSQKNVAYTLEHGWTEASDQEKLFSSEEEGIDFLEDGTIPEGVSCSNPT
jgi:DNA modification methylase